MTMTHPGLPEMWVFTILVIMALIGVWALIAKPPGRKDFGTLSLSSLPVIGSLTQYLLTTTWLLFILKLVMVLSFLLIITAGLYGTPIPERNIATILTWNLWWAGLVFSILFLGSAWCAICPWDALAQWLVRRRLWRRAEPNNSLNLRVPRQLRSVWPALIIFIGFTWLELGEGITVDPYATASVALLMVVMATVSMAVYQRKAFCRYFCPVGRTIGFYSQLSIVEQRPINNEVCANCQTLECYHGSQKVDPCPTGLMMGSLQQNTYCTSCGNCSRSCPDENISWRLRSPSVEAVQSARPHWDEACFMIALLALTSFHGITMMPFWGEWISQLARTISDSGQLLWSFSVAIALCIMIISGFYAAMVLAIQKISVTTLSFKQTFSTFAFVALPLAFAYHMAHNLNHLIREGAGLMGVFLNPLGIGTEPLTMMEKHMRHSDMLISQTSLFVLQSVLMLAGFIIAIKIIRYRSRSTINRELSGAGWRMAPMILFATGMTVAHLWLMMQPMVMRM